MKILEDEGFCTSCGAYGEYKYGDDDYSLLVKNLVNYNKYKDIFIYECPNCGFISTDITNEEGVLYGGEKNTYEYKQLYNYAYLKGLDKELYERHSDNVPANMYEAYAQVLIKSGDYEKLIRVLFRCIDLKLMMAKMYRHSQDELGGEEENDDEYDELDLLIKESIEINRKQIDYYYGFVTSKNIYLKLIYIENLVALGKRAEASMLFDQICRKIMISKDLKDYMFSVIEI